MRIAAFTFYGFSLLIVIVIVTAMLLNPGRQNVVWIAETCVFGGGFLMWSMFTAWRLGSGKGMVSAFLLIGLITAFVTVYAAQHGSLQLDEPIHPALHVLRNVSGLYVLLLWMVTIRALILRKHSGDQDAALNGQVQTPNTDV